MGRAGTGARIMHRLDDLARHSSDPRALTRLFLTPEHAAAAREVEGWMREAGMAAGLDAAGNLVGRYDGARPGAPAVILGSHIDSVRDAGLYDGNLGVVLAIEAVAALHEAGERLPFAVEVIAFGDEEGVRFPVTLTGSRAVAGTFDAASLDARDGDGTTLGEALRGFGCDPDAIPALARRPADVLAYLEVHIEQGPVLETAGLPVGVVTAIAGASRFVADVIGTAGHAGTVPMPLRRDALTATAEMVLMAERVAAGTPGLVATVGRIEAIPGAVNVVPGEVRFTLDIRSPDDAIRRDAIARLRAGLREVAERRDAGFSLEPTYDASAAVCAPALVAALDEAVARATGNAALHLPSGAGHDGLAMIALCPIAMLFVRCRGGISHNPAESITEADADVALRVMLDTLRRLRPEELSR